MKTWKIGDWAYCANIPGCGQITNYSFPWYLPGHVLYEIKFQGHYYFMFDWELE